MRANITLANSCLPHFINACSFIWSHRIELGNEWKMTMSSACEFWRCWMRGNEHYMSLLFILYVFSLAKCIPGYITYVRCAYSTLHSAFTNVLYARKTSWLNIILEWCLNILENILWKYFQLKSHHKLNSNHGSPRHIFSLVNSSNTRTTSMIHYNEFSDESNLWRKCPTQIHHMFCHGIPLPNRPYTHCTHVHCRVHVAKRC